MSFKSCLCFFFCCWPWLKQLLRLFRARLWFRSFSRFSCYNQQMLGVLIWHPHTNVAIHCLLYENICNPRNFKVAAGGSPLFIGIHFKWCWLFQMCLDNLWKDFQFWERRCVKAKEPSVSEMEQGTDPLKARPDHGVEYRHIFSPGCLILNNRFYKSHKQLQTCNTQTKAL